jgi:hypothetical protein
LGISDFRISNPQETPSPNRSKSKEGSKFKSISRKHIHLYLAEFDFRWNSRKDEDRERFVEALNRTQGKRLTYEEPIGERETV